MVIHDHLIVNIDLGSSDRTSYTIVRVGDRNMCVYDEIGTIEPDVWFNLSKEPTVRIFSSILEQLHVRDVLPRYSNQIGPGRRSVDRYLRLGINSLTFRPNGARERARRLRKLKP